MNTYVAEDLYSFGKKQIHKLYGRDVDEELVAIKQVMSYQFDNSCHMAISHYGNLFVYSLRKKEPKFGSPNYLSLEKRFSKAEMSNGIFELIVWADLGNTSLYTSTFSCKWDEKIPSNVIQELEKVIKDYVQGLIPCSDCGRKVEKSKVGRYFAGIYCPECWSGVTGKYKDKGGWRKIEVQETYN